MNQAVTGSTPSVINLDNNCLYSLSQVNKTSTVNNLTINNGLPVISNQVTINGNNAVIEIAPAEGQAFFGHFFIEVTGDLELCIREIEPCIWGKPQSILSIKSTIICPLRA